MTVLKAKVMGECVVHARKDSAPVSANSWNGMKMYPSVLHAQKQLSMMYNLLPMQQRRMQHNSHHVSKREVRGEGVVHAGKLLAALNAYTWNVTRMGKLCMEHV